MHPIARYLAVSFLPLALGAPGPVRRASADAAALPIVDANDNREAAGTLRGNVLTVRLVVRMARWYPEGADGPSIDVAALAEEGRAPRIPGPLIRVRTGTMIEATIRNALPDSAITVTGFQSRPSTRADSIRLLPGETRTVRFAAGAPGTYLYAAALGPSVRNVFEREQIAGAFVVDSAHARIRDRVFVINIWGDRRDGDSASYRNALTINGRAWPWTERISATVGDSVRWRFVNASVRGHPLHMHGFYFRVDAKGSRTSDSVYAPGERRLAVTEMLEPGRTMALTWSPLHPGNWLFHCHIGFHVAPTSRLDAKPARHGDALAHDPAQHMAGLVLGITVKPGRHWRAPPSSTPRQLRLFAQEGPKRRRAPRSMSFVLQRDGTEPRRDSIEVPGTTLVLTRGERTNITVINRLPEPTGVHWHGIELESWSDGVVGWSGAGSTVAPVIAPGDSFVAHLLLPRAGTFIYHTHLNDLEQLTSGLYGAILVLEPGARLDPRTDHLYVAGWDGDLVPVQLLVNGDSAPAPVEMAFGTKHRVRFVNIGVALQVRFTLQRDSSRATWRAVAKDGADLPATQAVARPAVQLVSVGETYDFEFDPPERGSYVLSALLLREGAKPWRQRIEVR